MKLMEWQMSGGETGTTEKKHQVMGEEDGPGVEVLGHGNEGEGDEEMLKSKRDDEVGMVETVVEKTATPAGDRG